MYVRPNKIISVFWVTGLKILGRVGTLFFLVKLKLSENLTIIRYSTFHAVKNINQRPLLCYKIGGVMLMGG